MTNKVKPLYFQFGVEIFPEFDLVSHPQGFCYAEVQNSFSYGTRVNSFPSRLKTSSIFNDIKNPEFIAERYTFPGRNYVADMQRNVSGY